MSGKTPYTLDDTVVALASPPGGAARGIVRLTGPALLACIERCFTPAAGWPASFTEPVVLAGLARLEGLHSPLPAELYLWPDRRSYTGQPVAEFHTLGSPPLLRALTEQLCQAGARLAQPGEFTLRAFLAGRIDLTQAEAVLGTIEANERGELDAALTQLAGGLARPLHALRQQLIELLVLLEAAFDFPDEDLEFVAGDEVRARLAAARHEMAQVERQLASRGTVDHLSRVTLLGWSNTGKSSLFNALAGASHAIVSHEAGTTRDFLLARIDLDGVTIELVDTAGAEDAAGTTPPDLRQAAGILAAEQGRRADLRLFCLDSSRPMNAWEREQLAAATPDNYLVVWTKSDQPKRTDHPGPAIGTSSHAGTGLDTLRAELRARLLARRASPSGLVAATALRAADSVRMATASLARAAHTLDARWGEELVAAEIRTALDALGQVVGAVYTDELLDQIFSRFCIGK